MNINKAVTKAYEGKTLKELKKAPVSALQGVSENDAKLLKEAFNIKTVEDLALNKYFNWAWGIVCMADTEE